MASKQITESQEMELKSERIELLNELRNYMKHSSFISNSEQKFIIEHYDADYNWLKAKTGYSLSGVKVFKNRFSAKMEKLLGKDFCSCLVGSVKEFKCAARIFHMVADNIQSDDIIDRALVDRIHQCSSGYADTYDLKDCVAEIKFLQKYSNYQMLQDFVECDSDKLVYLLSIIETSDVVSVVDRAQFIKVLSPSELDD